MEIFRRGNFHGHGKGVWGKEFYEWEIAVYELPHSKNKDCYGIVGKFAEGWISQALPHLGYVLCHMTSQQFHDIIKTSQCIPS